MPGQWDYSVDLAQDGLTGRDFIKRDGTVFELFAEREERAEVEELADRLKSSGRVDRFRILQDEFTGAMGGRRQVFRLYVA